MRIFNSAGTAFLAGFAASVAGIAPALAAGAFVTDDADTSDKGGFELDLLSNYTHNQQQTGGSLASFEAHYGVSDRFEFHIYAPLAFAKLAGEPTQFGTGDISIGAKYRLVDQADDKFPVSIAVDPTLVLPSGAASRNLGTGSLGAFLPVWASRQSGKWAVFGGGGLAINPGPGNLNWGLAGAGVTYDVSERWTLGGEVFYTSAASDGGLGGAAFNLGGGYMIAKGYHILFAAGRNLNNAAAVNAFSGVLGLQTTF